jgi:hypothetical protein
LSFQHLQGSPGGEALLSLPASFARHAMKMLHHSLLTLSIKRGVGIPDRIWLAGQQMIPQLFHVQCAYSTLRLPVCFAHRMRLFYLIIENVD